MEQEAGGRLDGWAVRWLAPAALLAIAVDFALGALERRLRAPR